MVGKKYLLVLFLYFSSQKKIKKIKTTTNKNNEKNIKSSEFPSQKWEKKKVQDFFDSIKEHKYKLRVLETNRPVSPKTGWWIR